MSDAADEIIRYEKDTRSRIATITFDRPERLNAPTIDTVFMQKTFFEIMKQLHGEYMGSMPAGVFESITGGAQRDMGDLRLGEAMDRGLPGAVKDNDAKFGPESPLSKTVTPESVAQAEKKKKKKP